MSKIKIFALAVITSLVLVTLRVGSISSQAQDSTKKYTDSEFGIALDYPYDWSIANTINNPQNTDPFIIQKRITLSNNINALTQFNVDIWRNFEGLSTQDWFDKYEKMFHNNTANLINGKDITISNTPAVLIFEEAQNQAHGRITMIVSTQDLVVRLDYYTNEGGLFQSEFVDIAKSIAFTQQQPVVNSQGVATNFPDAPFIGLNKATLQGAPCCGWVDPNPNTYPCSGGNCTWWAKYKRPDIGNVWGTAWEWRDRARQVGFSVGYTAHVGAIAVWQANVSSGGGWSAGSVGHVAYVESVESNGWFWVSSMSWGGSCTTGNSGVSTLHAHESGNENVTFIYGNGVHTGNDYNGDGKPDIYGINKQGTGSGTTEVHILNGADQFQTFLLHTSTALEQTGTDGSWMFDLGDYNSDGKLDMYVFHKQGTNSGTTEVHILNGADQFQTFLLHTSTALEQTGTDGSWIFNLGDYNSDGNLDLYVIHKQGTGSGTTEVHILNGADQFQTFLLHTSTALEQTGTDGSWMFNLGDYNSDGKLDVYVIHKQGTGSGTTEIHILNGADQFQTFLLHTGTALEQTGTDGSWMFNLGDYNSDGKLDVYVIHKQGSSSGTTDVHILNGADQFQTFLLHTGTALEQTGTDCRWTFSQSQCSSSIAPVTPTPVTPSPTSMTPSPTPSTTVTPSPSTTITPSPTSMTPSPTPSTMVTPSPTSITPSPTPVTSRYSVYLPMIQR